MSEKIKGEAEILYVWDGSAYEPIACLTSNDLSESRNVIESQTKCDPGLVTKMAGSYSYEISFEGEFIKPEASLASWVEVAAYIRTVASSSLTWKITTTYADDSTLDEYGTAILTDLSKTSPAGDELITFSGSLSGSGAITNTDPNA
ncbi:MAG: hypothetical protein GY793_06520 [Proteobacteria bacterium]|nr:hypothetical protein [Pseudomonadota bacterium]